MTWCWHPLGGTKLSRNLCLCIGSYNDRNLADSLQSAVISGSHLFWKIIFHFKYSNGCYAFLSYILRSCIRKWEHITHACHLWLCCCFDWNIWECGGGGKPESNSPECLCQTYRLGIHTVFSCWKHFCPPTLLLGQAQGMLNFAWLISAASVSSYSFLFRAAPAPPLFSSSALSHLSSTSASVFHSDFKACFSLLLLAFPTFHDFSFEAVCFLIHFSFNPWF